MSGEIVYKNHNKEIKSLNVKNQKEFSVFVKSNIREISWARYYFNNFLIDEYNNLTEFNFSNMELHFPARLTYSRYSIISKWNIEKFKDFFKNYSNDKKIKFWTNPESFGFSDINITLVDDDGNIVSTTLENENNDYIKPIIPNDIMIIKTEYLEKEFNKISDLNLTTKQKKELFEIDQFTMLNIGV
jgi:hypothetical protein